MQNLDIKGVRPLFGVRGILFLTTFRQTIPCAPAPACARLSAICFYSWSFRPAIGSSTPNSIDIMRRGHLINCKSLRSFLHSFFDRFLEPGKRSGLLRQFQRRAQPNVSRRRSHLNLKRPWLGYPVLLVRAPVGQVLAAQAEGNSLLLAGL